MTVPFRLLAASAVAAPLVALISIGWLGAPAQADEEARLVPPPALDIPAQDNKAVAVVAGGCFWGVQGVFQHVKGVSSAVSGYDGGEASTAHYELTSRGDSGHAESVRITFDPSEISYGRVLQIFFSVANDPTELNRQGPDAGSQYRSAIFPADEEQAKVAKAYIAQLGAAHVFGAPIVTKVEPGRTFYPAEDYHQDYLFQNPTAPYIVFNDLPKIENLKRLFPASYRERAALVHPAHS